MDGWTRSQSVSQSVGRSTCCVVVRCCVVAVLFFVVAALLFVVLCSLFVVSPSVGRWVGRWVGGVEWWC